MEQIIDYMDTELDTSKLQTKQSVLDHVYGAFMGDALAEIDNGYENEFGLNIIWHMPLSPHERSAGAIVPVQEGFLFLPYKEFDIEVGVMYDVEEAILLDADTASMLRVDHGSYSDGVCDVLGDIVRITSGTPSQAQDETMDAAPAPVPIIIEVRGGLVQCVRVPDEDTTYDIIVADYDNLENVPCEEGVEPHDDEVDRAEALIIVQKMRTAY